MVYPNPQAVCVILAMMAVWWPIFHERSVRARAGCKKSTGAMTVVGWNALLAVPARGGGA